MPRLPKRPRRGAAPRARRDPEAAKELILAAAEKLFAEHGPDAVGLKDVAREAGVSHALVSHYFGTFGGLVEAALERRASVLRQEVFGELLATPDLRPGALLERLWSAAKDPVTARLGAWALLTGRARSEHFFPRRVQGLRLVVDALEGRAKQGGGGKRAHVTRADLEQMVTIAVSFTYGYALAKEAIRASLGASAKTEDADDAALFARFVEILESTFARSRQ